MLVNDKNSNKQFQPNRLGQFQKGFSAYTLILLLIVGGFFALCGIKIIPHYVDYFTLKKAMSKLTEEPNAAEMSKRKIDDSLRTKLVMNGLKHIGTDSFVVERTEEGTTVALDYEIQEHLFANIDVLLTFKHEIEL